MQSTLRFDPNANDYAGLFQEGHMHILPIFRANPTRLALIYPQTINATGNRVALLAIFFIAMLLAGCTDVGQGDQDPANAPTASLEPSSNSDHPALTRQQPTASANTTEIPANNPVNPPPAQQPPAAASDAPPASSSENDTKPGEPNGTSGSLLSGIFRLEFSGVRTGLPVNELHGWKQCWSSPYSSIIKLTDILAKCPGKNLMLACRNSRNPEILEVAAHAPRADVLFASGACPDCTHVANGSIWYYHEDFSWGFAAIGDKVVRASCDGGDGPFATSKLCWHTTNGNISDGFRCGTHKNLNSSTIWERLIYMAD